MTLNVRMGHVTILFYYYYFTTTTNFSCFRFSVARPAHYYYYCVACDRKRYTLECKIIRNVYMVHHYPSAIFHLAEPFAFLASSLIRFFRQSLFHFSVFFSLLLLRVKLGFCVYVVLLLLYPCTILLIHTDFSIVAISGM